MLFRINQAHDPNELALAFKAKGRLHIPDFLEPEDAERLLDFIRTAETWRLVFNSGEKALELDRAAQAGLTSDQKRQFDEAVYAKARYGFQYRYETLRVPDPEAERRCRGTILDHFALFLSEEPALSFFRTLLGEPMLTFADAQATAYGPGHFLTAHDDDVSGKNRKAAFVMNLSRQWSLDWGGLLAFHNGADAIAEAFIPTFNSLNLFAVPQVHSVTMVAPFVPRRRYSVTGWLRTGAKP
jgi:Rps23 Pro-64 3,4-dihydroxylase Tpa1-like proline 4-hydroxylase